MAAKKRAAAKPKIPAPTPASLKAAAKFFPGVDLASFWRDSDYVFENSTEDLTPEKVSLLGDLGHDHYVAGSDAPYPKIGLYIANCPSGGHDAIALDYRTCGPKGEPSVVHVDQDNAYKITKLADSFAKFVCGLKDADAFPHDD